ncbi:MAG: alpha/beta hydrolase [Bdellovibrionota bacterium]
MSKSFFILVAALGLSVGAVAQTFDIYEAKTSDVDSASYPVVVFVHGGAWVSGNKSQYKILGEALASNKVCAVIVDYTLAPQAKHPQPVNELEKVIGELAKRKQGRCWWDRMYLVGHSAGAHMIAMWNATYENSSVKGFVGLEGIYDVEHLVKIWPGYKDWFVVKAFGGDEKKWKDASPRGLKMKSKAPWLVVHSDKDELVDVEQSFDLDKALRGQGLESKLVRLKTGTHFGVIDSLHEPNSDLSKRVLEFVSR